MTTHPQSNTLSLPLKLFLLLLAAIFAVAIIILIISATSAATVTGRAPSLAISLASEVNTGVLGPGEQRWFKFTPSGEIQGPQVQQAFTVFFTPAGGQQVSLQLFTEDQIPYFYEGNTGSMLNFGAGQLVSRDNDPNSGELVWNGALYGDQNYYLQLANSSEAPIDYWLLIDDVFSYPLYDEAAVIQQPAAPVVPEGDSPSMAFTLATGQNRGTLEPGQEKWYSFSVTDGDGEYFEEVALTMFATPNEGGRAEKIGFEVFTAGEAQKWSPEGSAGLHNVGSGSLVQRDNDPFTSERFWTGWVVESDLYYVRVRNNAEATMDYWLFTGDIYNPELGQ